jgi:hypothetical protein
LRPRRDGLSSKFWLQNTLNSQQMNTHPLPITRTILPRLATFWHWLIKATRPISSIGPQSSVNELPEVFWHLNYMPWPMALIWEHVPRLHWNEQEKELPVLFKTRLPTSTSDDGTSEAHGTGTRVFWPNDYLTQDIPDARIWTYGYNADVIGGLFQANNQNSVSQHGRDLAVRVEREIENKVSPCSVMGSNCLADETRTRLYLWCTVSAVSLPKTYV